MEMIEARFWQKVAMIPEHPCWEWIGTLSNYGYGVVYYDTKDGAQKRVGAHRYAWELAFGPIPDGLFVCHRCDNPRCVRPDHLFLGTHADNLDDMVQKGRACNQYKKATHCIRGHEFTPENTYTPPSGQRSCRACKLIRDSERRQRFRESRDAAR